LASTENTNPGQNKQVASPPPTPVEPSPSKGWLRTLTEIAIATLFSAGLITVFIQHHYDKKLRTHELKLERYMSLIDELSKLMARQPDWSELGKQLNAALLFSSDEVATEILALNVELTPIFESLQQEKKQGKKGSHKVPAETIKPLFLAIRDDLFLSSDKLEEMDFRFFIRVRQPVPLDSNKGQEEASDVGG